MYDQKYQLVTQYSQYGGSADGFTSLVLKLNWVDTRDF